MELLKQAATAIETIESLTAYNQIPYDASKEVRALIQALADEVRRKESEIEDYRGFIGRISNLGPHGNSKLEHANQILSDLRNGAQSALSKYPLPQPPNEDK